MGDMAGDASGHTQPAAAQWNRLGYANNAIQVIRITVTPPTEPVLFA
jgi:hypothetical protein